MANPVYIIVTNRGDGDITSHADMTAARLGQINCQWVFVPFWSWYIPPEIYERYRVVIFHMTDVPYGRGGSPLQNLLYLGHETTMISAIRCCEITDGGDVYMKCAFDISYGTADEIYDRADVIIRNYMVPFIVQTNPKPVPQRGKSVRFKRWDKNKTSRIFRAMSTDYENLGSGKSP